MTAGFQNFSFSRPKASLNSLRKRKPRRNQHALSIEKLDDRRMLAGLVMELSTFSLDQFESNLVEQVGQVFDFGSPAPNVIGYSYAMSHRNPASPFGDFEYREGADGFARLGFWEVPSGVPVAAGPLKRQELSSISKTITAVSILHLLQEQTSSITELEAFLDNVSISFFVPSNWNTTAGFNSISIRELLTHTSGIRNANVGNYDYSTLQTFAQTGVLAAKTPVYSTYNYALFRVMLPYMWNAVNSLELNANAVSNELDLASLSPNAAINSGLRNAIVADWNPAMLTADIASITPDRVTASIYKYYVATYVLEPSGINNPATRTPPGPAGQGDHTLLYYLNAFVIPGRDTGDQTLLSGSRGWNLSAREVEQFLSGIRFNDAILEPGTRDLMDEQFLGWLGPGPTPAYSGDFGTYLGHNGLGYNAPASQPFLSFGVSGTRRNNTQAMVFPNGVQASLLVNSQLGLTFGSSFNTNSSANATAGAMIQAYDHAWTDLVFRGNLSQDTMVLQANPNNADFIDFVYTNAFGISRTIFTRRHDTLDSLTINSRGGNDVLTLRNLPSDLDLQITVNGGSGNDSVFVENLPAGVDLVFQGGAGADTLRLADVTRDLDNILGNASFHGETGSDNLIVDDRNDFVAWLPPAPPTTVRTYAVSATTVARSGVGVIVDYSGVQNLTLRSSEQSSQILVVATAVGSNLTIEAGSGNDLVVLGNRLAASSLNSQIHVVAGGGDDELIIDDRDSGFSNENYVVQGTYFQSQHIPVISWDASSPPEVIRIRQNGVGTTTNVRDVLAGVRMVIQANGGTDTIRIHATESGSQLRVGGGGGNDDILLAPESRDLTSIQGNVYAFGGTGTDRTALFDDGNTNVNGRHYQVAGVAIDLPGTDFGRVRVPLVSGMEFVELRAGVADDLFDVRSWRQNAELQLHGNSGSDELRLAALTHTLDSIAGEVVFLADPPLLPGTPSPNQDSVVVFDDNRPGLTGYSIQVNDLYTRLLTTGFDFDSFGVERITLNANKEHNSVDITGVSSVLHKTELIVNAAGGDDRVSVFAPATVTVHANGGPGGDLARLFGTNGDDVITLQGNRLDARELASVPTTTLMRDGEIESFRLGANQGLDLLVVAGVKGLAEQVVVQATGIPGQGAVTAAPFNTLDFVETEEVVVSGNAGDEDSLDFRATHKDDSLSINPVASGTSFQPFVSLTSSSGQMLLTLRDASNVGVPVISGLDGNDTFRVTLPPNPSGNPVRNIRLEAGEFPSDKDVLIVSYDANFWPLIQPATNPNNGTLIFGSDPDQLSIIFRDFEELVGDLF